MLAHPRLNSYHNPKKQLLAQKAGRAPPAWKTESSEKKGKGTPGSKIMISGLPPDVTQDELEGLFQKTVGPVKHAFFIYNNQGMPKGMAVVEFTRLGDAGMARNKYNTKVIDGRKTLKVELIKDEDDVPKAPPKPAIPSLLQRLGDAPVVQQFAQPQTGPARTKAKPAGRAVADGTQNRPIVVNGPRKLRTKKGPRRLRKVAATVQDLDREMDEYRAQIESDVKPIDS